MGVEFCDGSFWVIDTAYYVSFSEQVDPKFFYYFTNMMGLNHLKDGTSNPSLTRDIFGIQDFPLPPLPEQREIAAILGALDDKIELNRKTSTTLEEMARALYRSWFVDFDPVHAKAAGQPPAHMDAATAALFPHRFGDDGLPEGWKSGVLGDFARNAKAQVNPDNIDLETPYIGLEHMPRRSVRINNWDKAEKVSSAKMRMKEGQFLFGKLRPYFHKVGMVPVDGICSTDILVIEAKKHHWCEFVLCVISSEELVEHANSSSTGTRMPRAKWSDLAAFEIAVPNDALLSAFSDITSCWYDRIHNSIFESQTLAALRDTLLPQLMSGELRVGEAREQVEEAV